MSTAAQEATSKFWVLDDKGIVCKSREGLDSGQKFFARDDMDEGKQLLDVIREVRRRARCCPRGSWLRQARVQVKPTILLGLTGVGGLFKEEHIREMAKYTERPIVFPLSNPTSRAECTARQAYEWTDGKAIFASGSPFDPEEVNGKMCYPSQCNNMVREKDPVLV